MALKTMTKMSRSNVKAKSWMKANGYKNIFLFPHTRWSKDLHFEELEFDGIASFENKVVFFQVKSNCNPTKKTLKRYEEVSARFNVLCLWFNAVDRKPLEVNNGMPISSE